MTIARTFNQLGVAAFPGRTDPFEVFVQRTGGIGRYDVHVEVHDLMEDRLLARSPARAFEWEDRLAPFELVVALPPSPVEQPGSVDAIVLANGREVDRQRLRISQEEIDDNDLQ